MRRYFLYVLSITFLIFTSLPNNSQAAPLDLGTFTKDGNAVVDETNGIVTFTESDDLYSSYFFNDTFAVAADALSLSFDYSPVLYRAKIY